MDFAHQMRWLVNVAYPDAECIEVVLDNLNTHTYAALYEAFDPVQARRLALKFAFHYTPKHASWLNMAEIEFSVVMRKLGPRVPDEESLQRKVNATNFHLTSPFHLLTGNSRLTMLVSNSSVSIQIFHIDCEVAFRLLRRSGNYHAVGYPSWTGLSPFSFILANLQLLVKTDLRNYASCCIIDWHATHNNISLPRSTLMVSTIPLTADRVVRTTCPYCGVGCQMNLNIQDDHIYRVTAPFDAAPNYGTLCVKGRFGTDFTTHPGRLKTPLIRNGDGPGDFREATWDEAMTLVAEKLSNIVRESGGDSISTYACAKATNEDNYVFQKFVRAVMKTNNIDHCARLCHAGSVTGLQLAIGSSAMSNSIAEMENLDTFIVTGSNTTETHPVISLFLKKAVRQNGAKLIVIDPRQIELTDFATLWLRQKPGTDVAVFQAMAYVIVTEKLYNEDFIANRTEDFHDYVESLESFTPEWAEEVSGVPADDIRQAARTYANAERAAFYWGMGISQSTHGTDNALSLTNLALMTGHLGKPGTGLNPLRGQNNVQGCSDSGGLPHVYTAYQRVDDPEVQSRFEQAWNTSLSPTPGLTVTEMVDGALTGQIRGMLVMGENPLMSEPNLSHAHHALEALDFIVCIDIFMNETSELADVILPSASFAEKDGTFTNSDRRVQRVRRALPQVGVALPDWQIICDLAKRMQLLLQIEGSAGFDYDNPQEIWEEMRSVTPDFYGITYERLESEGGIHWPCPDLDHPGTPYLFKDEFPRGRGKFWALEYGTESELPDDDYPYHLTTGRVLFQWHGGTMTRRSSLDEAFPEPILEMHPEDAQTLQVVSGDWIEATSRRGSVVCRVMVTGRSPVGTVFLPFHFVEAAANLLTLDKIDPRAKIPDFKMAAVQLRKADAPDREGTDVPLDERGAIKDPTQHVH